MDKNKIQIEFSQSEFEQLLQLVYLGEWMANANKPGNEAIDFEKAEQTVYAKAYDVGYDDLVEYDKEISGFIPTEKFEDKNQDHIDNYDNRTVIEDLAAFFTEKELESSNDLSDKLKEKRREELFDKYLKILEHEKFEKLEIKN